MKKNDYLLLAATGAYSFLFYQQNAGINFLIFTLVLLAVILIRNGSLLRDQKWLSAALLCVVSAVSIFLHSSALSIIANIFSLLVVSALSINTSTSFLFGFLFSIYSALSSAVFVIVDSVTRSKPLPEGTPTKKSNKLLATVVVIIVSILFFILYQRSNPLFAENTKWINFDFISVSWILFTLSGLLLVYAFFYHKSISSIIVWEKNLPLKSQPFTYTDQNLKRCETEQYAGLLLFIVLNVMLVILNVGDIQTLYFKGGLPKNISHSDFVHSGVGLIMLSIFIATALIMYLYRNDFPDTKNKRLLSIVVYLWILQNILMLSSTGFRNQIYIHDFNFTYKRVGVYMWLLLAAAGLAIMFFKILKNRSNWYLVKSNVAVWFIVLVLSATVNWDALITNYNIKNKCIDKVDFYYLFTLSDTNLPELLAVTKQKDFEKINLKLKNYTGSFNHENYYSQSFIQLLNEKIKHYLSDYKKDWRSYDLRDQRIIHHLYH